MNVPDWLEHLLADTSALQLVFWVVALCALIAAIVKLWPFMRNAVQIVDALVRLPAMSVSVERMQGQIDGIHHETHKNDGTSVKDAVDRIEEGVAGIHGRMDEVERNVAQLAKADIEIRQELENTNPKE